MVLTRKKSLNRNGKSLQYSHDSDSSDGENKGKNMCKSNEKRKHDSEQNDSDSSDGIYKEKNMSERNDKRKHQESDDDYCDKLVKKSKGAAPSELLVKSICLEFQAVLNEKRKYFEKFIAGATQSYDRGVKYLLASCSKDFICQHKDYVESLTIECIKDIQDKGSEEYDLLNAISKLLESVRQKKEILQKKLQTLKNSHLSNVKDMKTYEQDSMSHISKTERNLDTELKEVQKNLIEHIKRKTMYDMKRSMKGIYLTFLKEENNKDMNVIEEDENN